MARGVLGTTSILGAIGRPKGSPKRSFSETVAAVLLFFKKARIPRCSEAHVIFEFSENSKVRFWQTVAAVLLFV